MLDKADLYLAILGVVVAVARLWRVARHLIP